MGTIVYRRAQWGSTVALASCLAVNLSLLTWLVARSLRGALALPERHTHFANDAWFILRAIAGCLVLIILLVRGADEILLRYTEHPMLWSIVLGTGVNLMFAYDVPRLIRNAMQAMRVRWPLFRTPKYELDALPAAGQVRIRGTLADGMLRGRGVQIAVDQDPERTIIEGNAAGEVELIGEIATSAAGGYRDAPARIGPGNGLLYIFEGRDRVTGRLLWAAVVEMIAAGGLLLSLAGLWGFAAFLATRVG